MDKIRTLIIVGTRPDAIKMAPLYLEFRKNSKFETLLCSSGQHFQLLNQALEIFDMTPDFELKSMIENQSLAELTSILVEKFTDLYIEICPDIVFVHGDTTTAFISALSAFYLNIPIAHVEAGLRTHDLADPFPEEFNRQAIARISTWNFVPTRVAYENLLTEGIPKENLFLCGNTIVDSVRIIKDKLTFDFEYKETVFKKAVDLLGFDPSEKIYILVTLHRRESFGRGIQDVCRALKQIVKENLDLFIIFPVHLNPNVRKDVFDILGSEKNILLVEPIPYDVFISLAIDCKFIITDSGGIQEEAISLSKKVLVTRDKTERTEGMKNGLLKIISTDFDEIVLSVNNLLHSAESELKVDVNPFGSGEISKKIVDYLDSRLV
jgi:UDP-N-acetylglucosamine 2-epimerase (non-hydrolysing)